MVLTQYDRGDLTLGDRMSVPIRTLLAAIALGCLWLIVFAAPAIAQLGA
ncbi:MAG: hypothetical protein AAF289_11040 [Cyanobacteria bacterium P01_A01_bin.135]